MSNNYFKVSRTYTTHSGIVSEMSGSRYMERLSSRVEIATSDGLDAALELFHDKAVQFAPEQTGLLKNSIFYTTSKEGTELQGVNSYGGLHQIDEAQYQDIIEEQGLRKSERRGVATGYVGTLVSHDLDMHPDTYKGYNTEDGIISVNAIDKSYKRDLLANYKKEVFTYMKFSDDTQYAPYVEYGSWNSAPHPFMRPAAEAVRREIGDMLLKAFDKGVSL